MSTMEQQVSLRGVILFLVDKGQENLAKQYVLSLMDPERAFAGKIFDEFVQARDEQEALQKKQAEQRSAEMLTMFAEEICQWSDDQLIEWYGENGPSSRPFNPCGGEMDPYVQAVYHELFGIRLSVERHKEVKTQIMKVINKRYGQQPDYGSYELI